MQDASISARHPGRRAELAGLELESGCFFIVASCNGAENSNARMLGTMKNNALRVQVTLGFSCGTQLFYRACLDADGIQFRSICGTNDTRYALPGKLAPLTVTHCCRSSLFGSQILPPTYYCIQGIA